MYVHAGILSDPCELNVHWSAKIEQLMKWNTAEEDHALCLILFHVSPAICLWLFFLHPVSHKEKVA